MTEVTKYELSEYPFRICEECVEYILMNDMVHLPLKKQTNGLLFDRWWCKECYDKLPKPTLEEIG